MKKKKEIQLAEEEVATAEKAAAKARELEGNYPELQEAQNRVKALENMEES